MRNSTLQLKASATGSFAEAPVKHTAQGHATTGKSNAKVKSADEKQPLNIKIIRELSYRASPVNRLCSVQIHQAVKYRPKGHHKGPVHGADLDPGVPLPGETALASMNQNDAEPEHGPEDMEPVTADQRVKR